MLSNLTPENVKDVISWDVKNWSKALLFWQKNYVLPNPNNCLVLALGEREGGLSLGFAKSGYQVICSDYNELPEATKEMHKKHGVFSAITYKKIDMRKIDLADESVDIVVFKSVIGALDNSESQKEAFIEIYRVLKKGGAVLFAENLQATKTHQYLRKRFVSWGDNWKYITDEEIGSWSKSFNSYKSKSYGVLSLFGRTEKQRVFLSYIDRAVSPIVPKRWRYILFGVAIK